MTNILYISYDGLSDPLGQSQILPYLIGLSEKGYKISIISAEKEQNYLQKKQEIAELCEYNKLFWHPLSYTKKPPVLSTLIDLFKIYSKARSLHKQQNFKIIHCRSYISALIGLQFKRKFKVKFIFDMRGFWANERVDGKIWNIEKQPFKAIYNFFKAKEIEFLLESDVNISLTHEGVKEINSWPAMNLLKRPIDVIPCCVDTKRFDRAIIEKDKLEVLRRNLQLNNRFVLSYLGSIGTWYMLDEMLDFFKELKKVKKEAVFFFISTESKDYIDTKALERGIDINDIVVQKANYKEVPMYLSLSDAAIFFIKPAYSKKASSPVKQGELMSLGIPIVCNSGVGDTELLIKHYKCGYVVDEFNLSSYKNVISELLNSKLDPVNAIEGANSYFSLEEGIKSYAKIYHDLS